MDWKEFVKENKRVQAPARVLRFNRLINGDSDLDPPISNELDYDFMADYEEKWFD